MSKLRPEREGIMLCYPVDPGRIARLGESFAAQPKYKGERAHVEWFAGEPVLISSYGNEVKFMEHIKNDLMKIYSRVGPVPFDGELYTHGWGQERISGILRSTVNRHPDAPGLQYHIFDLKSTDPFRDRAMFLTTLQMEGLIHAKESFLRASPTILTDKERWLWLATNFIDAGYEGAILRDLRAPWVAKRSVGILKFKPTDTDEYLILEVNQAIDKNSHPKEMVGSFTVKNPETNEAFKVGAGKMKHDRRIELWKIRKLLPGKMIQVKHELLKTSNQVPVCAVAVDVLL